MRLLLYARYIVTTAKLYLPTSSPKVLLKLWLQNIAAGAVIFNGNILLSFAGGATLEIMRFSTTYS